MKLTCCICGGKFPPKNNKQVGCDRVTCNERCYTENRAIAQIVRRKQVKGKLKKFLLTKLTKQARVRMQADLRDQSDRKDAK